MKYIRQYTFLVLLLVSSIVYGIVKLTTFAGQYRDQKSQEEAQKLLQITKVGESMAEAGNRLGVSGNQKITFVADAKAMASQNATLELSTITEVLPEKSREFRRVEMDYLSDALFIGDSRTSTLYEYAGWEQTDFFVKYGLTIWDVWEKTMDGKMLEEMLSSRSYGKVYIMLGVNELGTGTPDTFCQQFQSVVEQIRALQPDAVIFVEAILHVTAGKDAEGTYINNVEINARNQKLQTLADNQGIFWLDANEVMDEPGAGTLRSEYSFDGVHLKVKYINIWQDFLLDHGIIE